ncbi:MAG: lipoyl(octanoyl) transferase LipB [Saprospiraceae bacterium]|nr:lipoyl(octanoyl) transferase LipB [Candidatus Vicinibacter affinis]
MSNRIEIHDLGQIDYQEAWDYQTKIHNRLISEKRSQPGSADFPHVLILCEHPHVYTLGKSGEESHLKINEQGLGQIQASFYKINRGGDITYHGPGQLVAYPILDLDRIFNDVHRYVRGLEESVILTLAEYGILGDRLPEYTGVWLDPDNDRARKICAIGVHLSRWVSLHGLALNVNTNLNYFNHIIPCGIQEENKTVTSIQKELGMAVEMAEIKQIFTSHFLHTFGLEKISKSKIFE